MDQSLRPLRPSTALRPSTTVGRISSSAIRELLALVDRPGVISLAGGLPSAAHFPVDETLEVVGDLLRDDPGVLQYSASEGDAGLRAWIAEQHGVTAEQVVVTHGSQQALDLVARAWLEPGDAVVLADPGYVGAIQALRLNGGCLVGLPSDGEGLCVEALEEELRRGLRPRLVYVVPNFHNPTGASLSAGRARLLAGLADRYGFLLLEDDPYGAIRFAGQGPPRLRSLTERCVSVGTISKVLFPGLRVGWLVAPDWLAQSITLLKQAVDLHTSTLAQRIALRLLDRPDSEPRLAVLRDYYRGQAAVLVAALAAVFGDRLAVRPPDGGLFLWGRLTPAGIDSAALLPRALERGVAYVPGSAFSVSRAHDDCLRLSYAGVSADDLVEGVRRLAGAVAEPSAAP